ncbi:hypothetical protein M3Y99_00157000 [Aphelenchoides fujianensis]|nr:hypothetical protein M3Y99_00157000 [Aphelenchoides fujianensis]
MAASCKHRAFLSSVHSVQNRGADVRSSKNILLCRPGTKFRLVLTKQADTRALHVKIAIEGSAKGLKGEIRVVDEEGIESFSRRNAELNRTYRVSASLNHRVFCKVWTEECLFCKDEVTQKAAAKALKNDFHQLNSQIHDLKHRLAKQQEDAENTQKQLRFRIRAMEEKAVAKKRNYGSIISALGSQCGTLQQQAAVAAESQAELVDWWSRLESEVEELKSALADEQTRFSALQQEHRAEIEAERKERADELASVNGTKADETLKEENECMRSPVFNFKPKDEEERQDAAVSPSADPAEFSAMRDAAFLTDFCLVLKRKEIAVHRNVLALKSTFFESLFRANPQATKLDVDKKSCTAWSTSATAES